MFGDAVRPAPSCNRSAMISQYFTGSLAPSAALNARAMRQLCLLGVPQVGGEALE